MLIYRGQSVKNLDSRSQREVIQAVEGPETEKATEYSVAFSLGLRFENKSVKNREKPNGGTGGI